MPMPKNSLRWSPVPATGNGDVGQDSKDQEQAGAGCRGMNWGCVSGLLRNPRNKFVEPPESSLVFSWLYTSVHDHHFLFTFSNLTSRALGSADLRIKNMVVFFKSLRKLYLRLNASASYELDFPNKLF